MLLICQIESLSEGFCPKFIAADRHGTKTHGMHCMQQTAKRNASRCNLLHGGNIGVIGIDPGNDKNQCRRVMCLVARSVDVIRIGSWVFLAFGGFKHSCERIAAIIAN